MARKIVHLPAMAPELYDTGGVGVAGAQAEFTAMRDALRTGLASLGVKVSDIGIRTSGTITCMLFEMHDPVALSSMYVISGYSSSSSAPDIDDYLGLSGANLRTRAKATFSSFASSSTGPAAGITFLWNSDTSISRAALDFDDATELTYTGGDFTALTTLNPDSLAGLQALSPSHSTYGMTADLHSTYRVAQCMGYDSTAQSWMYMTESATAHAQAYCMWGPILDSSAGANEYGTLHVYGTINTITDMRGISHTQAEVNAFDAGGTSRDYDLSPTDSLNSGNYIVTGGGEDGRLNWKKVEVNNGSGGSGIKGHVKEGLFVEIGQYRSGHFRLRPIEFPDTANPVICVTESCAIWWEDGARMFPSYFSFNE